MLSYVSNIVFIFFMAGAMTEIRDEIRSITVFLWEFVVCLRSFIVCLCYFFIVVFVFNLFFFICSLWAFRILCLSYNDRFRETQSGVIKYCLFPLSMI